MSKVEGGCPIDPPPRSRLRVTMFSSRPLGLSLYKNLYNPKLSFETFMESPKSHSLPAFSEQSFVPVKSRIHIASLYRNI